MAAVGRGLPEVVELLIGRGASLKITDKLGESVVDYTELISDEKVKEEILSLLDGDYKVVESVRKRRFSLMSDGEESRQKAQKRQEALKTMTPCSQKEGGCKNDKTQGPGKEGCCNHDQEGAKARDW